MGTAMPKNNRLFRQLGWVLLCAGLGGCVMGPDYHPPSISMPKAYEAASKARATGGLQPVIDATIWWKSLGDPELDALIDRAIVGNLSLDIALDHVQAARIQEEVVLGGALPEASLSAGYGAGSGTNLTTGLTNSVLRTGDNRKGFSKINRIAGFYSIYELDLFGKYRRELQAARFDTQAMIAARNNVLISVTAAVARAYVAMRAGQMQLAVLQNNITDLQQYVNLTQERFDRGITNELDLSLAQRQLAGLQAQQAPLAAQIHAAQYLIATLLGRFPEDMAQELEKPGLLPALPAPIEAGLPLDLLRRRPDIQQVEREAAAATARIGAARADLFPSLSLAGAVGGQAGHENDSGNPRHFIWSLGSALNQPLLDFGTLDALVDAADLNARQALIEYKQTVLNAVREVDATLDAYHAQEDRLTRLDEALLASRRSVDLATQRYERGLTDSLNVIDAQRQEYELQARYITAQQDAAEQFIDLYKALGGGWERYQTFPPLHRPRPAVAAALASLIHPHDGPQAQTAAVTGS